ncbi:MAG: DUF6599 family protein [Smithellaceae bacterium]|nr:DUF6599 family protein [Smithellaceae bacterium]
MWGRTIGLILGILLCWFPDSGANELRFPEIAGWKRSADIQTFTPQSLYEYINGAADLYLSCDFEELQVAEYVNERKASVTVEAYRHRTPRDAFGIYSQERLPEGDFIRIGAQGYIGRNFLNFLAGRYYVKISSSNTGDEDREVLLTYGKRMAESLGEKGGIPTILSSFPAEGKKVNSEKYITRNFLGYPFLHSAYTADYELTGKRFKLFLLEAKDRNEGRVIVQAYIRQVKSLQKDVREGRHTLSDPHHGIIDLYWKGAYIWGTFDLADGDLRSEYLRLFEERLRGK